MRYALLADIHANREAFDAVRAKLKAARIDRVVLLGDLVGYGPDPAYCVDIAEALVSDGALAVLGNHDAAVEDGGTHMNSVAKQAISWTRDHLTPRHRAFLRALPETIREGEVLFVHANARAPRAWDYVTDADVAERSLRATDARISIVGHVHVPHLWRLTPSGVATGHAPVTGVTIPLATSQVWLAVMGAVGQPRDGKLGAAYGILDTKTRGLSFERADYDHFTTARKVREAGLPPALADRLLKAR